MKTVLAFFSLICVFQVAYGQTQSDSVAISRGAGWESVLPAGSLKQRPTIVAVDRGFVFAAESFADPSWRYGSPWVLYDPAAGRWSGAEKPPVASALKDLDDNLLRRLNIADLIPDIPGIKYQYVDAGNKLAFLIPDDYMFDRTGFYSDLIIVDPAGKTAESRHMSFCQGPPKAELVVWDFPDEMLSVICSIVISHEGASTRLSDTYAYIGRNRPAAFQLLSHSPDHRYWIMRVAYFNYDDTGDVYIYDRQTGVTSVMFWSRQRKPQRDSVVWLNSSSLLANMGEYILCLDMSSRARHELLRDEIARLPGDIGLHAPMLSKDRGWLLVAAGDGCLHQRNISAALAALGFPEIAGSAK